MKEHEYQNAIRGLIFYFLAAPAVILIGMFFVGTLIDSFANTSNTFSKIFIYIGGIPGIAAYYYDRFIGFKKRAKRDYDNK
jgi:ABC-type multidrug transport system permease subunit